MNLLTALPGLPLAAYRWLAIALVGIALFGTGFLKGCQHEEGKYNALVASTKALGDAQTARAKQINQQQADNFKAVTHDLLANVDAAGALAVDNYRARYGSLPKPASCGAVPGPAAGVKADDGAGRDRMAVQGGDQSFQPEFVKSCARDAARLDGWIEYATLNHIPIKE